MDKDQLTNIFQRLPDASRFERDEDLLSKSSVRITRILSQGQTSVVYDQDDDEWVIVLVGEAEITFPDEHGHTIALSSGDFFHLEAGRRHKVTRTSDPCLWLCVFFPPDAE
ncbi:MAG: cupin domain-containing protein [Eubacteriales bacterium]|nr:cupin domain-containing protein [Eubacteriales bacterium]MDD4540746.1 cupin domain-containing protein [Eubacteriales bacterium]